MAILRLDWQKLSHLLPTSRLEDQWEEYEESGYVYVTSCHMNEYEYEYKIFSVPKLHKWLMERRVRVSVNYKDSFDIEHVFFFNTEKDKLEFQMKWM